MASSWNASLVLTVGLTASSRALAVSVSAALSTACVPSPGVFAHSSCVFSQPFCSNVTCRHPQGWEHGQVISRAGWTGLVCPLQLMGTEVLTEEQSVPHHQGILESTQTILPYPYLGSIQVCVAEWASCVLGIPVCGSQKLPTCCLLFASGKYPTQVQEQELQDEERVPRARSYPPGVPLAQQPFLGTWHWSPRKPIGCSAALGPHHVIKPSWLWLPASVSESLNLQVAPVWPGYVNLVDWWPVEFLQGMTWSVGDRVCWAWALCAETGTGAGLAFV